MSFISKGLLEDARYFLHIEASAAGRPASNLDCVRIEVHSVTDSVRVWKYLFVPASLTSRAESVFEDYLGRQNLTWEYESLLGRKKPDYVVQTPTGKCVIEVKQIEDPETRPVAGFSPDRPVRKKIRRARTQLGEYKEQACSLVVYSESIFGPSEPSILLAAAFGPGYQKTGRVHGKIDPSPSFCRFFRRSELPTDLQFLSKPLLSHEGNRTFSALVLLQHYELNELLLEVWRRLYARQQAGQDADSSDQFQLLQELGPALAQSRRYAGTTRVIVVENRFARIPLPDDLFRGPFDQRWGWEGDWCGPAWIGSTLESLYGDGVPFHML